MPYYPILVELKGKKVLVVGGGIVAQRKIETLLKYGALVQVVSHEVTPTVRKYLEQGRVKSLGRKFREDYMDGTFLVIAATDDPLLNKRISEKARERDLLVNAVDQPSDCTFIVPSILRRGDLLIAVSTSGKSPALAKKVREDLEKRFGPEYASLLNLMGRVRKEILSLRRSQDENRRTFHKLLDSHILEAIKGEDWNGVAKILNGVLQTGLSAEDVTHYLADE